MANKYALKPSSTIHPTHALELQANPLHSQEYDAETPEKATYESDNDDEYTQPAPAQPQKSLQRQRQQVPNGVPGNNQVAPPQTRDQVRESMGYRAPVIRESRIKDRPVKKDEKDSAVKIKIELDLEVYLIQLMYFLIN